VEARTRAAFFGNPIRSGAGEHGPDSRAGGNRENAPRRSSCVRRHPSPESLIVSEIFSTLFSRAEPGDVTAVAERLTGAHSRELIISHVPLPARLWWAWFAGSSLDGCVTMAARLPSTELRDPHAPGSLCRALLDMAEPAVNAALYRRSDAGALRLFIAAGCPTAGRARTPEIDAGLLPIGPVPLDEALVAEFHAGDVHTDLNPAVVATDAHLVAHVLDVGSRTSAERLLGLLRLFDLNARDILDDILDAGPPPGHAEADRLFAAFLAGTRDRAEVEAFVVSEATPEAYARRLREITSPEDPRLSAPHTFGWAPIVAAHHESPLNGGVLAHLAVRHGWDRETRRALFGATPDGASRVAEDCFDARPNPVLDLLTATEDVDDLIASTAPAWDMLIVGGRFLPYLHVDFTLVEAALDRVVRRRLGDDADAWVRLALLARTFPGSLEQLVEAALDPRGDVSRTDATEPGTGLFGLPETTDAGQVLRVLLRGVPARTAVEVARRVPTRTAVELFNASPPVADPSIAVSLADPDLDAALVASHIPFAPRAEMWTRRSVPLLEDAVRHARPVPAQDPETEPSPVAPATYRLLRGCVAAFALGRPAEAEDLVRAALAAPCRTTRSTGSTSRNWSLGR